MTLIAKKCAIDKLDNIVNKYNNAYHKIIEMKLVYVNSSIYIEFNRKTIRHVLNYKLVIMLGYQNIKLFLLCSKLV